MLERQVGKELELNLYQIHDKDFVNASKKLFGFYISLLQDFSFSALLIF